MRVTCKQKPAKSPPQAQLTLKLQLPTHSKWQSLVREKSLTPAIRRQSRNILPGPVRFAIATKKRNSLLACRQKDCSAFLLNANSIPASDTDALQSMPPASYLHEITCNWPSC